MDQNGSQKLSGGHPFWLPKSTLAPKATFGCTLVAFWLPFGTLSPPFWSLLAPFGSLSAPFWSLLAPFCYLLAPLAPFWHPLRSIFDAFLNFESFLSLFLHLDCLQFRFWSHFQCKYNFGAPNAAGNPQQNYSRISTVGTQPFLGPGRVYCRRQLRSAPGRTAPQACWDSSLACSLPCIVSV